MRLSALLLTSAVGLSLAGCGDVELPRYKGGKADEISRLKVVTQLECPESQGDLTRVRVEANGSCVYAGPKGSEVTLRLVSTDKGESGEALKGLDDEIRGLMPRAAAVAAEDAGVNMSTSVERSAAAKIGAASAEVAAKAEAEKEESVDVRLPGLTIRTKGENATVRMPGIHIEADDSQGNGERAQVDISIGGKVLVVRARDDASEIRTTYEGADVHTAYLLIDEKAAPSDWTLAGYEAAGPKGGPLVVAVVKAKAGESDKEKAFKDAKRLLERNVGKLK